MDLKEYLAKLNLLDDEGNCTEFKEAQGGLPKTIWESLVAFANSYGGYIFLGIDSEKNVLGIKDVENFQDSIASIIDQKLVPPISPEIKVIELEGRRVIQIYMSKAEVHEKPVYLRERGIAKGAFKRVGSSNINLTEDEMRQVLLERSNIPADSLMVDGISFADLDLGLIENYRNRIRSYQPSKKLLGLTDEGLLKALKLAEDSGSGIALNRAAILIFGKQELIEKLFPEFRVQILIINGTEWVPTPGSRGKKITIESNSLLSLIPEVEEILDRYIPANVQVTPGKLERELDPVHAGLREALVNAFVHQDYLAHRQIQIRFYSNRLEIDNPGISRKSLEVLQQPGSYCRNPLIVNALERIGWVEHLGTGIQTMIDCMHEANLTPPIFDSDNQRQNFQVTFYWHHFMNPEDIVWASQFTDLLEDERRALVFCKTIGSICNADYRSLCGTDTLTASKKLGKLRKKGYLEQKDTGSKIHYVLDKNLLSTKSSSHPKPDKTIPVNTQLNLFSLLNPSESENDLEDKSKSLLKSDAFKAELIKFCLEPRSSKEIAEKFNRSRKSIRTHYLTPMIKDGTLAYTTHPNSSFVRYIAKSELSE